MPICCRQKEAENEAEAEDLSAEAADKPLRVQFPYDWILEIEPETGEIVIVELGPRLRMEQQVQI